MIRSLTDYWTTKSTAGHAPPASEETGIRCPCTPTCLEDLGAKAFQGMFDGMTPEQKLAFKEGLKDAEDALHELNCDLQDDKITGEEVANAFAKVMEGFGKPVYRGIMDLAWSRLGHIGDWWK